MSCATKDPVRDFQRKLEKHPEYAITLHDMKDEGNFFPSYYHKYKIVVRESESPESYKETLSSWMQVKAGYYKKHVNNLGMTLASKTGDEKSETPQPQGYQYVGNPQYGQWRSSGGVSFWQFYGMYHGVRAMHGFFNRDRVTRKDHAAFHEHRQQGRSYYGRNGEYGSNGTQTQRTHKNFFERRKRVSAQRRQAFQQRVRQRATRSHSSGFRRRSWGFGK